MLNQKDAKSRPEDWQHNEVNSDLVGLARNLSEKEKKLLYELLENDPLTGFYKKSLIVYLFIAITLLLWPFDFIFSIPKNDADWIKTSNGIEFLKTGKIISYFPATPLYDHMLSGSGLCLEVLAAPATTDQSGPARIISYSLDHEHRNFTLGQSHQKLVMRLRTNKTDKNGVYPHMVVDNVFNSTEPQHLTITYDFSIQPTIQRVYINGEIRAEQTIPGGDFSNWDPTHYLVLGNEVTGERPWAGRIFNLSIYNRALTPHEVRHNYIATASWKPGSQKETHLISSGLVVRYVFDEHKGNTIQDSSGTVPPLHLNIAEKLKPKQFLTFSFLQLTNIKDTFLNLILFIPFGFLLSGTIQKKRNSRVNTFLIVLIAGTFFTISIESVQYFLATRSSSLFDVINNILSTILGIVLFGSWKKLLRTKADNFRKIHHSEDRINC